MLTLLWVSYISFMAALSGAVIPGPVFAITVSESLKRGYVAGPLIVAGHLLLEALIIAAAFMGLDMLLDTAEVRALIGFVGGSALIVMGLLLLKSCVNLRVEAGVGSRGYVISHGLVAAGFLSSGSNPQFFIWWLTIGLPMIKYSMDVAGLSGLLAFMVGHALADLGWFGLVGYSAYRGKSLLSERVVRLMIVGSAIFLLFLGCLFIYQAYSG